MAEWQLRINIKKKNKNKNYIFFKNLLTKPLQYDIIYDCNGADMAQSVEHILGKDEVIGSIPIISSKH